MVSEGRKIKALWDANKDVLMGMVLGSLANMRVTIHWNHRPEVTQGLIVESSFTLPSIVANCVLKNGKCHITLKAANSESGSVLASQVAGYQESRTTFPSKPFSAFPRSRTPWFRGRAAQVGGASQPDDGDDEEADVDDGDEEQAFATRTTREKKAAYQVAAEAREARFLKFAMDEARKAEVASRAAEAKRRKHEHSLGRFTRCSSGHGPGVRIFAANPA